MTGTCAPYSENLFLVMQVKYVWKSPDVSQILRGKRNGLNSNGLAGFDHFFQLLFGAGGNYMTVIHNCDPCTDLLHFFHIMGSVNDGGTLFIQLLNAFQDFVPLWGSTATVGSSIMIRRGL